jgi:SAM-dependent methyltransferase
VWGLDRGLPIDRYYIHRFLWCSQADIRGDVLEVKEPIYTCVFGAEHVRRGDVLDIDPENTLATVVADLGARRSLPEEVYDCFILTQTLQLVHDVRAALANAFRCLKPGGVLLASVPSVSRVDPAAGVAGDFWRFTGAGLARLVGEVFDPRLIDVWSHGNLLACTAFLHGLAACELTSEELDLEDPYFPLVITVRARKGERDLPSSGAEEPVPESGGGRAD